MSKLVLGAVAPSFSLEDLDANVVSLESMRGRRVLVSFLRNAGCAVCNLWVQRTARLAPVWRDAGLDVLAIFEASAARLRTQFTGRSVPFPVLADPAGLVHDAYGSRTDAIRIDEVIESGVANAGLAQAAAAGFPTLREEGSNFFRIPAEVLIDEHGVVARIHVADEIVNHLSPEEVDAFARRPSERLRP